VNDDFPRQDFKYEMAGLFGLMPSLSFAPHPFGIDGAAVSAPLLLRFPYSLVKSRLFYAAKATGKIK
jgi:hypothetical protein